MPAQKQDKEHTDPDQQGRQQVNALIGKHVIRALGQPGDFHGVQVRHLWADHYRVNVLVGVGAAAVRIAHSYFLLADGDGNVIASTPKVTRQY